MKLQFPRPTMLRVRQVRRAWFFTGVMMFLALAATQTHSVLAAILPQANLSGFVFCDSNFNGILDNLEWTIADAPVWLMQSGSDGAAAHHSKFERRLLPLQQLECGHVLDPATNAIHLLRSERRQRKDGSRPGRNKHSQRGNGWNRFAKRLHGYCLGRWPNGGELRLCGTQLSRRIDVAPHVAQHQTWESLRTSRRRSFRKCGNRLESRCRQRVSSASGTTSLIITNAGGQGSLLSGTFSGASGDFTPTSSTLFRTAEFRRIRHPRLHLYSLQRGSNPSNITITTNVGNLNVSLTGKGVAPISLVSQISPVPVLVVAGGTNSASGTITVKNIGDGNLAGDGDQFNLHGTVPGFTGIFSTTGGTLSLKDGISQDFVFNYAPTVRTGQNPDTKTISIAFTNGNPDGTNTASAGTVTVTGTAVAPVSSWTSVNPGYTLVGGTNTGSITITNIGDGNQSNLGEPSNLHGSLPGVTGIFSGGSNTFSLGDTISKTFNYTYAPTTRGANSTTLLASFQDGNPNGTNTGSSGSITISGTAVAPVFSMSQINAGAVLVGGTASGSASITIQNIGDGNLAGTGDHFNLQGSLSAGTATFIGGTGSVNLTDNASQTFNYVYQPTTRGENSAVISATFSNGSTDNQNKRFLAGHRSHRQGRRPGQFADPDVRGLCSGGRHGFRDHYRSKHGRWKPSRRRRCLQSSREPCGLYGPLLRRRRIDEPDRRKHKKIRLHLRATTKGTDSQDVTFNFDNGNPDGTNSSHTQKIAVTGTGVAPVSSLTQASAGFVLVGSTGSGTITVQNIGNGNLSGVGDNSNLRGGFSDFTGLFSAAGGSLSLIDGASQTYAFT